MRLVLVTWLDAETDTGWKKDHEVRGGPPIVRSVGWIIHRTRRHIILAADVGLADGKNESNRRIVIPTGMLKGDPINLVPRS